MQRFQAEIDSPAQAPRAAFIRVPFDVKEVFGTRGRVPVRGTFDGYPYRGTIQPMGGQHIIGVSREMRQALGKAAGDTISVTMERGTEERAVEVPEDLAAALTENPDAQKYFDSLAYSHRKEYVGFVTEAKKPETRAKRIARTIEMLEQKLKASP